MAAREALAAGTAPGLGSIAALGDMSGPCVRLAVPSVPCISDTASIPTRMQAPVTGAVTLGRIVPIAIDGFDMAIVEPVGT